MRRSPALALLACLACTTPLELGERRYSEGDRLAALETWRRVGPDELQYEAAQRRITEVEDEFEQLVIRYKKRGRYYEHRERLGESILNYRLALKLQPDDRETLEHVQRLTRVLDERKQDARRRFDAAFDAGRLDEARAHLGSLRALDPFDAELQAADRRLDEALQSEVEQLLARGRRGFSSGNHARAERAFRSVLQLDPENDTAQGYLSYISTIRIEDQREMAGPLLDDRVHASEREIRAEGFYRNALKAEEEGRPFAAIRHDLRALRLDREHAGASRHLASLRRRLEPALEGLIEQGRNHYQQEELESALDDWRRALLIDPRHDQARDYVARAERLLQNLEQLRSEPEAQVGAR